MFLYYDGQDFYKRMLEIQEKLRKSEEERIRLEERFKLLVQESRNRHDACINRLRLRYIEFLEEQRDREERNNKLQGALDKVDNRLASMTVKSDRLNALRKYYEAYLLQAYGTRSCESVTGDSGVTSQHEERSFRKDMMAHSRRHSMQSASIPPSTPTTNFSRVVTPSLSKYSELKFVDPPRTHQSEFSYSHQQPIYSTSKVSYNSKPKISSITPQIPEIRVSPTFSPTLVSKDVQTDKPINSVFDQSFGSMNPYQISGIGRLSQSSTQTLPQFPSQFPNQFSNQYSHQVTPNPQIDVSQYLYTPSLPKTADLGSRTDFRGFSDLENTSRVFRNTSPTPSYPDYSWRYPRSTKFEEKSPRFERSSIFERNSIFDESPIHEKTSIFDKSSIYERNSRFEDKSPPRFFRRFDFNTTFRRNDRPLPSSRDILSSTRPKSSLKPFRLSTSLKSDYDVNERSRRMDNELDRYIGKIRNLHRDVDLQSLEDLDHEQNTSGDLLNVTLSDDDIDLPVEEKNREKRSSKKGEMPEVSGKQFESEESASRVPNTDPVTQTDAPVPETRREVSLVESDETSAVISADGINSEIAKEVEIAKKLSVNDLPLDEKENPVFADSKTNVFEKLVSGADDLPEVELKCLKEIEKKEQEPAHAIDQTMEADKENDDKEKKIVNEKTVAGNREQSVDRDSKEGEVLEGSQDEKKAEEQKKEGQGEEGYKENDYVQNANQEYQYGSNQDYNYDPNTGYEQYPAYSNEVYDQYNQQYDPNQHYSQDPSQYVEGTEQYSGDPNQQYDSNQQYDPSQYVQDPNQQYEQDASQYVQDPSQSYEQDSNQYVQDSSQQYAQDPSQQYAQDPSQQYAQDPNQQYTQDPSQEYVQDSTQEYVPDPNQEYVPDPSQEYVPDPNQEYVPDPSQEYVPDPSQEYVPDPTQEYVQDPSQEFVDPNQQYAQDSGQYDPNQEYQNPNVQYDPNQAYDYSQTQGYSEQDQTYNSDQPYDQNYTPEAVVETDKVEVKAEEKETLEATSIKKKEINLESDTESTIERNVSNTESDFDFN